nr:hypothetical protein [Tanacetum cinerariifolium]
MINGDTFAILEDDSIIEKTTCDADDQRRH